MDAVRFQDVSFRWPDGTLLVDSLDLDIQGGSITAILGASGSGKSTLLRLAAGLLEPSSGSVEAGAGAKAFVFQKPTLLPWRSVEDNVRLPLELGATEALPVRDALAQVGLSEHASKLPGQLSGGQQMRASLARALVTAPQLLLMDEPFAAVDALTRRRLHRVFLELHEASPRTVVLVTHDIDEALMLADVVMVLGADPARITQVFDHGLAHPRSPHDAGMAELAERIEAAL